MRTLATFTIEDRDLGDYEWKVVEYDDGATIVPSFFAECDRQFLDGRWEHQRYGFSTLAKAMAYALLRSGWYLDDLTEAFEAISGGDS